MNNDSSQQQSSSSQVWHIFIYDFNRYSMWIEKNKHNTFTWHEPTWCSTEAVRLWIQYLQSVINCNTLWLTGWEGWGLIVEYSYPCDIILPYIIHLILQQLHMRKKVPLVDHLLYQKKSTKVNHIVYYMLFILIDLDSKFWENPWRLSLEIVDNVYHLIWISWVDSTL